MGIPLLWRRFANTEEAFDPVVAQGYRMLANLDILKPRVAITIYVAISQVVDLHTVEASLVGMQKRLVLRQVRVVRCLINDNDIFLGRGWVNRDGGSTDDREGATMHTCDGSVQINFLTGVVEDFKAATYAALVGSAIDN